MEFIVDHGKQRLDKFLAVHLPNFSRTQLQRCIKDGSVTVNGQIIHKTSTTLKMSDCINIAEDKILNRKPLSVPSPEADIPLDIVYEDADVFVINKPAGLLTHPTLKQPNHTLVNAILARNPKIIDVGENVFRPGIVHRLDKDTSGLIIIAKTNDAFTFLKKQFLEHRVQKTYIALVEGVPKEREGTITLDIRSSKRNFLKKVAIKQGSSLSHSVRAAETYYKVQKVFDSRFALLEVQPRTGRTHQIRAHLKSFGTPVAGDRFYGARTVGLKRQFLHSTRIEFVLPSGKPIVLESPLPNDLQKFLKTLDAK